MSDRTTHLQFPFLAGDQAQKHVTINESLLRLDALVQLAPKSLSMAAEPATPSDGDLYILPPGKTGAHWGAMANHALAYFRDGIWEQVAPRAGFVAFIKDTQVLKYYDGAAWLSVMATPAPRAGVCDGRLTLESGAPASPSDQLAKTVVYFTPDRGNQIGLYDGSSAWALVSFTEASVKLTDTQSAATTNGSAIVTGLANTAQLIAGMDVSGTGVPGGTTIASVDGPAQITLSANATATGAPSLTFKVAADTNVDVFGFNDGGVLKLQLGKWSNGTTRAPALALQDGALIKSGATTRRYLGTIRTTNVAGQCEDSLSKRFVWNAQNRRARPMRAFEATDSWTYSTAAWRQANGSAANQLSFVRGLNEDGVSASVATLASTSSGSAQPVYLSIGLDGTTAIAAGATSCQALIWAGVNVTLSAHYSGMPGLGYHALTWLEHGVGSGTQTWYGDAGGAGNVQGGIVGTVFA